MKDIKQTTKLMAEKIKATLASSAKPLYQDKKVVRWNAQEVVLWLATMNKGFCKYHKTFVDAIIDGRMLITLKEQSRGRKTGLKIPLYLFNFMIYARNECLPSNLNFKNEDESE